jgi:hypothetical protein
MRNNFFKQTPHSRNPFLLSEDEDRANLQNNIDIFHQSDGKHPKEIPPDLTNNSDVKI